MLCRGEQAPPLAPRPRWGLLVLLVLGVVGGAGFPSSPRAAVLAYGLAEDATSSSSSSLNHRAPTGKGPAVAYRGAVLETVGPAGRIENGTVVVRGGKLVTIGPAATVVIPSDARIVNAQGWTIMPGIVDPYSVIRGSSSGGGEVRTITLPNGRVIEIPSDGPRFGTTFTKASELFQAFRYRRTPLVRIGLTSINFIPEGYGQGAVVQLSLGQPDRMLVNPEGLLHVVVANDASALDVIRRPLQIVARGRSGSSTSTSNGAGTGTPSETPKADAPASPSPSSSPSSGEASTTESLWRAVSEGKSPLLANVTNAAGLLHLLKILDEHKEVKLLLVMSGTELLTAEASLEALKARGATLVLTPGFDLRPNTRSRVNVARLLHAKNIPFVFTLRGNNPEMPLFPIHQVVTTGLPRGLALQAITLGPAKLLGVEKSVGSLETDKVANLLIFEGDPLDVSSRLREVLVEGESVYAIQP